MNKFKFITSVLLFFLGFSSYAKAIQNAIVLNHKSWTSGPYVIEGHFEEMRTGNNFVYKSEKKSVKNNKRRILGTVKHR